MDKEFLEAIRNLSSPEDKNLEFQAEDSARALAFDQGNFSRVMPREGRVLFLDGGSQPIIETPGFTICQIRIYWAIFSGKKKVARQRKDHQLILGKEPMLFPAEDVQLPIGFSIDECRRRLEIAAALKAASSLGSGDVLCLDGSLVPRAEKKLLGMLASLCEAKGIILVGVSKTSDLLTAAGTPVGQALEQKAQSPEWAYFPVQDFPLGGGLFGTGFVRFHGKARYSFRFDAQSPSCLQELMTHCRDPSFLGYPYGLVDADRFARVGFKERERQRLLMHTRLPWLRSIEKDAHQGIDRLNKL